MLCDPIWASAPAGGIGTGSRRAGSGRMGCDGGRGADTWSIARHVRRMATLNVGDPWPEFSLDMYGGGRLERSDLVGQSSLMVLHRYAACPICSQQLAEFRVRHAELAACDLRTYFFFHSPLDKLTRYLPASLPFAVVVDPDRELYQAVGVGSSMLTMLDPRSMAAVLSAREYMDPKAAFGDRDGPMSTLPASFIVDANGRVAATHYARHLGDRWTVDEIVAMCSRPAA